MASTTTRFTSSNSDETSVGTHAWQDKGNANATDGTLVTLASNGQSYYGIWDGFGFTSSDIPVGATVNGLEFIIRANRSGAAGAGNLVSVKVVIGGGISGSEQGTITLTGTLTDYTVGGATNLLGTSPIATDIHSSAFGIAISGSGTIMGRAQIDSIKCLVYYTASGRGYVTSSILVKSILVNGLAE